MYTLLSYYFKVTIFDVQALLVSVSIILNHYFLKLTENFLALLQQILG